MTDRSFHNMLSSVGDTGPFQTILLWLSSSLMFQFAMITFTIPFLFYQDQYTCPSSVAQCQQYVCGLDPSMRSAYIDSDFSSFISQFGDYRCTIGGEPSNAQVIIFGGGIVGLAIGIFLKNFFSMRRIVIGGIVLSLLAKIVVLTSSSFALAVGALSVDFASRCVTNQVLISYVPQMVGQSIRVTSITKIYLAFSVGATLPGVIYWLIHPWWVAYLVSQIIPYLIIFLLALKYLEESLIQQAQSSSIPEIKQSLMRIATINGKQYTLSDQHLEEIMTSHRRSLQEKGVSSVSAFDLVYYRSLRVPTLLSLGMHFFLAYQFNGTSMVLKDYQLSPYLNGPVINTSQILASFVCLFITSRLPRIRTIVVCEIVGVLISVVLVVWFDCSGNSHCPEVNKMVQTVGVFIYRCWVSVAYTFFCLSQAEFFPSQIRGLYFITTAVVTRAGMLVIPLIQTYFEQKHSPIIITFSISAVGMILFSIGFPETFQIPPPQVIEELQQEEEAASE